MALLMQGLVLGSCPTGELCYLHLFSVLGCFRGRTSFVADRYDLHNVCCRSVAALSPTCLDACLEAKLYTNDATMSLVLTLVLLVGFFWCGMGCAGRVTNLIIETVLTLWLFGFVLTPLPICPIPLALLVLQPVIMTITIGII